MKPIRLTLTLLLALSFGRILAQEDIFPLISKGAVKSVTPFDSTRNYLGVDNPESYKGQYLYVHGLPVGDRENGYFGFKKDEGFFSKAWGNRPPSRNRLRTRYEDLVGRLFYVQDIINRSLLFLLQDVNHPEVTVWYEYNCRLNDERDFPFLVLSHMEYLQNNFPGKKFITSILKETDQGEVATCVPTVDVLTEKPFKQSSDDVWECESVVIEQEHFQLKLFAKNQSGDAVLIDINDTYVQANGKYKLFEKGKYDEYVAKFGKENMEHIRRSKIRVGMSAEMLRLSWGEPRVINQMIGNTEQWLYNSQFVSLSNGIIQSIY